MIKIGITGQGGFIGQHLYNSLKLYANEFEVVDYDDSFFESEFKLLDFVGRCDVIVHLAATNRHSDPLMLYKNNVELVSKLISALESNSSKAHVLFSSSSQEECDNWYGRSKREGRDLLIDWSARSGGKFTGLVIPNVYGPFGRPYYNSFIATFSYQLTHDERPEIQKDSCVRLIYVGDLIKIIFAKIRNFDNKSEIYAVPYNEELKVSEVLTLLEDYKRQYFDYGIIPDLSSDFQVNLFNTFRSYIDIKRFFPITLGQYIDSRGTFVELVRLKSGGQVSFSSTNANVTRGNHFHTRKIERFAVIKGEALIQLRKIGSTEILDFCLSGRDPSYVDIPIWFTHNIKNIGKGELLTVFWINEFYNASDPDTFLESV